MKTFRIYSNWMENGKLSWSIDSGDHRDQLIVDSFELRGCDAKGGVDPRWTKEEAREEDAPKCWFEVGPADLYLSTVEGERKAVLTRGKTGPVNEMGEYTKANLAVFESYMKRLPVDQRQALIEGDWSVSDDVFGVAQAISDADMAEAKRRCNVLFPEKE